MSLSTLTKTVCVWTLFFPCLFFLLVIWSYLNLKWEKTQWFLFPRQICRLSSICLLAEDDQKKNSSLLTHIANLPGFDASTARFATQYSTRCSPEKSVMEIVPTAAELMLPWRRDHLYPNQNSSGGGGGTLRLFVFFRFVFNFVFNEIEYLLALLAKWCHHTHTHFHSFCLITRDFHFFLFLIDFFAIAFHLDL